MSGARPKSRQRGSRLAALTAILVTAGLGVAGCSYLPASWSNALGQTKEVTGYFDNSAGLFPDNDVDVLGMKVGRVLSLTPAGDKTKVKFSIDNDTKIPSNAEAVIVNASIITDRHIELTWDRNNASPIELKDGGVIRNTRVPVEIGQVFDSVNNLVQQLNKGPNGDFPYAIVTGNGEQINATINELAQAAQNGSQNSGAIVDVIKKLSDLTGKLVANYPKMQQFSANIADISNMLGNQSVGLVATMNNLNDTLKNTTDFLAGNSNNVVGMSSQLAGLTANLRDYSRELVETIDIAPLMFQNLANSVSPQQRAWRAHLLTDKTLLDGEALSKLCEVLDLQADGCRTGKLTGFGPDLGVFSGLIGLTK
ncbi:MCE family protein [Jongsikchunia kroppenstedtii]|uniref:MCE family protein n=1 Tax=Jongsikchunia kroppenstedtii TaxID=1121721 RepID=UPI0003A6908E|nr:MCE family protein [Jongsikchunia kroppenstedtii]